jgi:YVTN family beta-propeller protein
VSFGGRPVDVALSPDRRTLYVKDNRGVVVVDAVGWRIRQELSFPAGGGSMHGIVVSRDGTRVYATTAQDQLYEASTGADGTITWMRAIRLPGPGGKGDSHACGLALAPDPEDRAYVCLSRNNSLGVVDLKAGRLTREIPVGVAPWDVALSPDGRTAYVSDWGGRHPRKGERGANSSGTDTLVDERGIAASGAVSVVDLSAGREVAQVETGLHPSALALCADGKTLFAANANSDTISVIDTGIRRVTESILVRPDPALPFGSAPTGLALSSDGETLWVTLGGSNAVAVVALGGAGPARTAQASRVIGLIPTGWYPGAVVTDGHSLFIANVKGTGSQNRPAGARGFNTLQHLGTVSRVPLPSAAELRRDTAQVRVDARVAQILRGRERGARGQRPVPVPERVGEPSVFEHVVYIIKENRTYDQVFGDLTQGNGDPSLCIFGRDVTPNQHALAEQFVLLDHFYCNGVLSADGHCWATEGNVTDHLEKSFGGFTRSYTWGDDPLTYSSSGFLWDNVLRHGLSVRNYGEMDYAEPVPSDGFQAIYQDYRAKTGKHTFRQSIGIARLRALSCRGFPGWNLSVPDVLRADIFLQDLQNYERSGTWPHLVILFLGNDHTSSTSPRYPTPRAQVADNDLALGRIVERITKSRFWPKTCLFVVEDDPQNGFDHVDGHRSPALVVSPYTKRGTVIHEFYNQTSVLHTIEQILGLPPMNQFDALAPLMRECFTGKPDFRPYTSQANRIALDEMNPPVSALHGQAREWARKSLAMDFQRPDEADEDTLNRILWHSIRGVDTTYPVFPGSRINTEARRHGEKTEAGERGRADQGAIHILSVAISPSPCLRASVLIPLGRISQEKAIGR